MPLSVHLLVSLDSVADTWVDGVESFCTAHPAQLSKDTLCIWARTRDWLSPDPPLETALARLRDLTLERIQHRSVEAADVVLALCPSDPVSASRFRKVYEQLRQFLPIVVRLRTYLILPRSADELVRIHPHVVDLLNQLAELALGIQEIHILIRAEARQGGAAHWPEGELASYHTTKLLGSGGARLDEVLCTRSQRTCHSIHTRCVFDRAAWRTYHTAYSAIALTARAAPTAPARLDGMAREFITANQLVEYAYRVQYPAFPAGSAPGGPEGGSLKKFFQELQQRETETVARLTAAALERCANLETRYRDLLRGLINEEPGSLDGLERALYLHRTIEDALGVPEVHQPWLTPMAERACVSILGALIRCINGLAEGGLAGIGTDTTPAALAEKLDRTETAIRDGHWPPEHSGIAAALASVVQALRVLLAAIEPDEAIHTPSVGAFEESLDSLDKEQEKLRRELEEAQNALAALQSEFGFCKRILHRENYRSRRQPLEESVATIRERQTAWQQAVRLLLDAMGPLLSVQGHLKLIAALAAMERDCLENAGQPLAVFDRALAAKHKQGSDILDRIPEEPEFRDIELSFLGKRQLAVLCSKFGAPAVGDYLRVLLPLAGQSTLGDLVLDPSSLYLQYMDGFCNAWFENLPRLDMPSLMFEHFPELAAPRIQSLIRRSSEQLLPLSRRSLTDRHFLAIVAFPEDAIGRLTQHGAHFAHRDQNVALEPAQIAYAPGANPDRLSLTLSVCGFRVEDYLFWQPFGALPRTSVAQNAEPAASPPVPGSTAETAGPNVAATPQSEGAL